MTDATAGLVLADRYELGRQLGRGGAGSVWSAHDRVLDRTVAVKVVPDGTAAARLAREARATAGIAVQHVVAVYDVGRQDGLHYLVMELVNGVDLATLLRTTGPVPADLAALVGRDVAHGVAAIHEAQFVHRDVSPSNVLVSVEGEVKLTDLGIARRIDAEATRALTQAGTVVGTVDYLAPEQVEGGDVDAATDVYAIGLLVHALCTGAAPFGDGPVGERIARRLAGGPASLPDSAGSLGTVVAKAVARDPGARHRDGAALRAELSRLVPEDEAPLRARLAELVEAARADDDGTRPEPTDAIEAVAIPARQQPGGDDATTVLPTAAPAEAAATAPAVGATAAAPAVAQQATRDQEPVQPERARDEDPAPEQPSQDGPRRSGLLRPVSLGIGGIVLAVLVATAVLRPDPEAPDDGGGGAEPTVAPLAIAAVADHDPLGGGDEHPEDIDRIADGDPGTAWDTEGYETADLGGLKSGVGLLVDLGAVQDVAAVELDLVLDGVDLTVTVSEERPAGDPTESGTVLGTAADAGGTVEVAGGPVAGRWVAVWFTSLADDGRRHRAEVAEVRVLGP